MPATTTLAVPYPAPGDTPDVPYHMQQLAEKLEALTLAATAAAAADDAAAAALATKVEATAAYTTYSGSPIAGAALNSTKPVRRHIARVNTTSNAQGLLNVTTPAGAVSILAATPTVCIFDDLVCLVQRISETTLGTIVLQTRSASTGLAVASTTVVATVEILWQS